ncbi:Uncharacterised protein [Mycobacterium tuberculosis]|uniref:Uncharacterized protein n=1 Tax=Mycobacterium tuberculosis TaxID=1773 RepID=A0A916LB77_MYCTX|nr:Uncharacterised protein [Mycobacterium tuberculosis]
MTFVNRRQALAPSTCAALSRSSGTSANPAKSSSDINGVVFQTSAITTMPNDGLCCVSGALSYGSRLARYPVPGVQA